MKSMYSFEYFCALNMNVEIIFITDFPVIPIQGKMFGPYKKNLLYEIPFFVALELHRLKAVNICTPYFLNKDYLMKILQEEESRDEYSKIDENLFLLYEDFIKCAYDIEDNINSLVNQIREIRLRKTISGLKYIDGSAMNMNNLTECEYKQIKDYMVSLMEKANKIETGQK